MKNISRRNFFRTASLAAGAMVVVPRHVLGGRGFIPPSDQIRLGIIGTGKLSLELFRRFTVLSGVKLVAACDVHREKLLRFRHVVEGWYGENMNITLKGFDTFEKYEDLLAMDGIDAVIVDTPDHWHAIIAIAAMKAGKDVYCEKPLAHTIEEGRAMVNATRKYNRILQTGSMQRSWTDFRHACELVRNRYVGEIKKILVSVGDPAVACDLPAEPVPEALNWDRWVGPAQMRPYHQILAPPIEQSDWPMWRLYREFGGGILSDWGTHMFDIAQWALGMDESGPVRLDPPKNPAAKRGLKFTYASGVEMVHEDFGRGWAVRFIGTEGSLDISREFLDSKPENIVTASIPENGIHLYKSVNHYADWIQSIKQRTLPVADVETGHRSASICNMANIAYQLRKPLKWDPVKEEFDDKEANRLRGKEYRKPYLL